MVHEKQNKLLQASQKIAMAALLAACDFMVHASIYNALTIQTQK